MCPPVTVPDALSRGRVAFERGSWSDAYAGLSAAAIEGSLELEDLEHLALAAELVGRHDEGSDILARAHQEALRAGDLARAAHDAFWLGFGLIARGEFARGGGWIARAAGLIEEHDLDCVTRGYLELPGAIRSGDEGDAATALAGFERASEVAARFGDRDLATLGRLGRGTSLVALGERERGVALLDEAMVAVTAGEVGPIVAGIVYCATIECCQQLFDLRRAQEWTAALTRWCESQPDLVPFRGRCMLYRAELLQFHGAWGEAVEETRRAFIRLSEPPPEPAVGAAHYQEAELHRLRGEFEEADASYRQGAEWGRPPEPGFALLRLAQGDRDGALAIIRRALDEVRDPATRTRLLDPAVEIYLANDDVGAARAAADELASTAQASRAPLVRALAARGLGAVLLADGDARAAMASLRQAWTSWQGLEAPFQAAQVRVLIGRACRMLGDEATAQVEFEAARRAFEALGAAPDAARVAAESPAPVAVPAGPGQERGNVAGLTSREIEVLRLVAAGKSNRAVAESLVISEKTVARHVSNIFLKLDVSSRSAATAYAYEHGLQAPTT